MQHPRSGSEVVGGIPWMARMIDKARLDAEGTIDRLDLAFPCPIDRNLLFQLEIDAGLFRDIVVKEQTDEAIMEALKTAGAKV